LRYTVNGFLKKNEQDSFFCTDCLDFNLSVRRESENWQIPALLVNLLMVVNGDVSRVFVKHSAPAEAWGL